MQDELAQRLGAAGIAVTLEQLETIRDIVAMVAVSRGAYDPIEAIIALLKPPAMECQANNAGTSQHLPTFLSP